ncbi:MAG: SpaA isopeptide-forming pilin-related protein [Blautia sp.]|jgi:uncharacterized surface anchored protein
MNRKHKKWKRFLAFTLTAAMLAPNSSVLANASEADTFLDGGSGQPSAMIEELSQEGAGNAVTPGAGEDNGGQNGDGNAVTPGAGEDNGGQNGAGNAVTPGAGGDDGGQNGAGNAVTPGAGGDNGGQNGAGNAATPGAGGDDTAPTEPVTEIISVEGNDYISQLEYTYTGEDPLDGWYVALTEPAWTQEQQDAVNETIVSSLGEKYQRQMGKAFYELKLTSATGSEEPAPDVAFRAAIKEPEDTEAFSYYYIDKIDQIILADYPAGTTELRAGDCFGFVKAEVMPDTVLETEWNVNEGNMLSVQMTAPARAEIPEGAALAVTNSTVEEDTYKAALDTAVNDLKKVTYTAFDLSLNQNDTPVSLANDESARITFAGAAPWGTGTVKRLYQLVYDDAADTWAAQTVDKTQFASEGLALDFKAKTFGTFVVVTGEEKHAYQSEMVVDGITFTVSSDDDEGIPQGARLVVEKKTYDYTTETGLYQNYDMRLVDGEGKEVFLAEGKTLDVSIDGSGNPIFEGRGQLSEQKVFTLEKGEQEELAETLLEGASIAIDEENYGAITSIHYSADTILPIKIQAKREMTVYDMTDKKPASSWVQAVTLYRKDNNGNWVKADSGYVFEDKEPIKMSVQVRVPYTPFDDENVYLYPGDTMELQLPQTMKNATNQKNIPIKNGNTVMGTFSIDDAGRITVNLNDSYLNLPQGKLGTDYQMEFEGSLNFTAAGEQTETETLTIGGVTLTIPVKKTPIEKQAGIKVIKDKGETIHAGNNKDAIAEYQEYKIRITASATNTLPLHTLNIEDYFDETSRSYFAYVPYSGTEGTPVLVIDEAASKLSDVKVSDITVTSGEEGGILKGTVTVGTTQEDGLKANDVLVLKYKVKVNPEIYLPGANNSKVKITARNTAKVTTEYDTKGSDWEDVTYTKSMLEKKYDEFVDGKKDENGYAHYTVHINMNPLMDLSGYTLVDDLLGGNQEFQIDADHPITLKYYSSSMKGTLLAEEKMTQPPKKATGDKIPEGESIYYNQDGALCIDMGAKAGESGKTRGQCHIQLGYWTKVNLSKGSYQENLKNTISLISKDGGAGIGGSSTVDVKYAVYSIGKEVNSVDLLKNRIQWTSTLNAYPHQDVNEKNYIPAGAVYEDKLSIAGNAKTHKFEKDTMELSITDKNGKELAKDDYHLETSKEGFQITFQKSVLAPVKITYNSYAEFGKGINDTDELETYINQAQLKVNQWSTGWVGAKAEYQPSMLIQKSGAGYDRDTRTLTWKIELNKGKYNLGNTKVSVKETLPEGLTLTKITCDGKEILLKDCEHDGNVWIIPVGELGSEAKTLVLTTKVEDAISEDNGIGELVKSYTNQADILLGEVDYASSSATQQVTYFTEDKLSQYQEGETLTYTIYVNEKGQDLNPEGETFYLKDTMETSMALVADSLKVYDLSGDGKKDITGDCNLQLGDAKGSIFTLTLPDHKPLKVEYRAAFTAAPGTEVTLTNKAELYYEDTKIIEVEETSNIDVKSASGSGTGPVEIKLRKVDQDNIHMMLKGAEFELYQFKKPASGKETWQELSAVSNYRKMPGVYRDENAAGNTDGIVEIPNVIQGVPYLVKETKAPEGYSYTKNIFYVFLVNKDGYSYEQITDDKFFLLSADQTQFYVRNSMAELAVDKVFTVGNASLKDGELPDGTYYFAVYTQEDKIAVTQSGQQAVGAVTVQNGRIQKSAEEAYALSFRLPYGKYTVYETDAAGKKLTGKNGYLVVNGNRFVVTDDTNMIHSSEVTVDEHSVPAVAKVTNRLTEEPLKIKAKKLLEGRGLKNGEFKFTIKEKTSNAVVATGTNDKNGEIKFSAINYRFSDKDKNYTYLVEEVNTNNGGVTFGKESFQLEVKVGKDAEGTVKIESVSYADRSLTQDGEGYYQIYDGSKETAFVNTYAAKGSLQLEADKKIIGTNLTTQQFDFTICKYKKDGENNWAETAFKTEDGTDGSTSYTAKNTNQGKIQFQKDYFELADMGEYKYVVEEADSALAMYEKDVSRYAVYVTVSDGGNGKLKFDKKIKKLSADGLDESEVKEITFHNTYKAEGAFTPTVKKILQGREIEADQFSFRLEAAKADWTSAEFDLGAVKFEATGDTDVKNDADGNVTFSEITYQLKGNTSDTGYYIYKITENIPEGATEEKNYKQNGYTYAFQPVYLYVEVKDAGEGVLEVIPYSDTERDTNEVTLTNLYEADGTILLNGTKNLEGTAIQKDQFTFTLWGAKKATQPEKEEYVQIGDPVKNDENGSFAFPVINYKADPGKPVKDVMGTYWYRIQEEIPTPLPEGYEYCSDGIKEYVIKVVVTEDKEHPGKLKAEKTLADGTALPSEGALFTNSYKSEGQWNIEAEKVLKGTPLLDGRYAFTLKDEAGNVLQTAANKENGTIAFTPVTYSQADMNNQKTRDLVYYIQEVVPEAVPNGVTYDNTLYKIYVTLTDDGKGHITVGQKLVTVKGEEEKEASKISFTNTFNGSVTLNKTAEDGVTPLSGVTFEMYAKKNDASSYQLYGTYVTNGAGRIYISGLPENDYYFVETKAADGYVIETDASGSPVKYHFTISMSGKAGTAVSYSLKVRNQKAFGKAELTKTDADTKKALRGVEFSLYTAGGLLVPVVESADGTYAADRGGSGNAVTVMKTNGSGKITVTNLEWGTYYFKETKALEGYLPTNEKFTFVIDESSFDKASGVYVAKTMEVSAVNKGTSVDILKVDEKGRAVKDAVLAVRDPQTGEILDQWTSNGRPHTIYGVLSPGKTYYLEELSAPEGYFLASPVEFTVGADGTARVTLVNEKKKEDAGEIRVDKRISVLDDNFNEVDLVAENATYYVGLFTDPEGKHPYGDDYIKRLNIRHSSSSGAAVYKDLPSGTYYILEVEADGTPIPMDELQGDLENGGFVCTVDGDGNSVSIDLNKDKKDGFVHLNNRYYKIPSGFSQRAFIDITKKVLRGTEEFTADDTFYAGVFTKNEDGSYSESPYTVVELKQNGTVTVEVSLGGEAGDEPVDYYVFETDADGNVISGSGFAYEVSGEGKVTVQKETESSAITITNKALDKKLGILKVDETGMPLEGAQFKLVSKDGESYVEEWTSESSAHYMDLEPGTYTLTETAAPSGYVKGGEVQVTVKEDGSISVSGSDAKVNGQMIQYVNKKNGTVTPGGNHGTSGKTTFTSSTTKNVKTGDETDILKYLYLLAAGAGFVGFAVYYRRKKRLKTKE